MPLLEKSSVESALSWRDTGRKMLDVQLKIG
jgi:hypothetical protein